MIGCRTKENTRSLNGASVSFGNDASFAKQKNAPFSQSKKEGEFKPNMEEIKKLKKIIIPILKRNDVVKAGIFGSYARGEAKKRSDIDILIKFKGRKSLFDLAGVEIELEKKLGKKADVLTYKSIHPLLKERILREEVRII